MNIKTTQLIISIIIENINKDLKNGSNPDSDKIYQTVEDYMNKNKIPYEKNSTKNFVINTIINHMAYIIRVVKVDFSKSDDYCYKPLV